MTEPDVNHIATAPVLNPGDRLAGKDADGNDAIFVVLSVHRRPDGDGRTSSTYVLRQRDGWTITVGEGSLAGDEALFRVVDPEAERAV